MSDYNPYLTFKTADGSQTFAATASMGLLHWFSRGTPRLLPPDPKPFVVYKVGRAVPGPYDDLFLHNIGAAIERTFGVMAPDIPKELLNLDWYRELPEDFDHKVVAAARDNPWDIVSLDLSPTLHEKVKLYESTCLGILRWLREHGDITELEIAERGTNEH